MTEEPQLDQLLATDLHVQATNRLMEALVESENRMRRRLELLADAVIETDAGGSLVFVNHAWESLTGRSSRDCLGLTLTGFFPPDCREQVERVLGDRSGEHQELSTRIEHADGRTVRIVLTTSPITAGGVVAVLRDVTREHEYQEELSKLSIVASSTSNLVVITDALGRIDWVNPAFEITTGHRLDEVRGRTPGSFLQGADTDQEAIGRIRAAIHERRATSEEILNYSKSGEAYWITLNLTPVFDAHGELERFISVQADITERKRIERMKNEFVSTVSHELRTPLTSISGAVGLLLSGAAGPLPDKVDALLHLAQRNGDRLTLLVNDLLDMERLAHGGMPIEAERQSLMPIVTTAINENLTYADQHDVRLSLVEGCDGAMVEVDSLRLIQVLSNLLSNACKFSPAGTSVDIHVSRTDDRVHIAVRDHGPGVPETFRNLVFEKFWQGDGSDTRTSGGTGLGLAISKELVEHMGGSIGYEPADGQGTVFFVDLPLAPDR